MWMIGTDASLPEITQHGIAPGMISWGAKISRGVDRALIVDQFSGGRICFFGLFKILKNIFILNCQHDIASFEV